MGAGGTPVATQEPPAAWEVLGAPTCPPALSGLAPAPLHLEAENMTPSPLFPAPNFSTSHGVRGPHGDPEALSPSSPTNAFCRLTVISTPARVECVKL